MEIPKQLRYTKEHEWARIDEDGTALIGVTEYAVEELGDVVFLELPEVGDEVSQGATFGTVESVKAVAELYAPLTGEVTERNEDLLEAPETLNEGPYEEGWLIRISIDNADEVDELMSADEYQAYLETLD
ncbi:MAG: glycine cleavage system protein GcvH [Candidatus Dadabacteria bacterium]|nr:MAG: glycine cleavage system protein GcvH [Candidatus Dadabacteria bacterium]